MKRLRAKVRATVVALKADRVLVVSKNGIRWALPGGKLDDGETPAQAAPRELIEETALSPQTLEFLFHFDGATTAHHVFFAAIDVRAEAVARNEIRHVRWVTAEELNIPNVSDSTREMVRRTMELRYVEPDGQEAA